MKKILLILLSLPTLILSQTQIGQSINGEAIDDYSGNSISLSSDGNIIAIAAYYNDGSDTDSGHVRVYENIGGVWTQIGQDIDGEVSEYYSGKSIDMSSDGSIVAIGSPYNTGNGIDSGQVRIYQNIGSNWTQVGQDINGETFGNLSGYSLSLSSSGNIVAIGAYLNDGNGTDSGHVRVYENIGGTWTQIGQDIDGEGLVDLSGYNIDISSNGDIVAIGAHLNDGNGLDSGHVRVYENIEGVWTQIGSDIDGSTSDVYFGINVSLSSDGNIVAVSEPYNDENGVDAGQVRIYQNIGGTWTQIGNSIYGVNSEDYFGSDLSLSSDGTIVAIGSYLNDENGMNSGEVKVFQNIGGVWTQVGIDINGSAPSDFFGVSLSLSSDGSILAVGAYGNDENGQNSGQVRVFDLSVVLSNESFRLDYFSIYPNPAQSMIKIELNQDVELKSINIYNTLGKFISSTQNLKINTNNLTSGIYFIEVETNKGNSTKKLIVE